MWLKRAQSNNIYELDLSQLLNDGLFHGTSEPIEGALRPGGYDNILWHAENPAIAQSYISPPRKIRYNPQNSYAIDDPIYKALADILGYGHYQNIERDKQGRPTSWTVNKKRIPEEEIHRILQNEFKYSPIMPSEDYHLLMHKNQIMPSDYRTLGTLHIGLPRKPLNLADWTDVEGDLTDPQYHKLSKFHKLQDLGYDGVIINDFLQSPEWGDTGHKSWGLFDRGIDKMQYHSIPAKHYDAKEFRDWQRGITPDFLEWDKNRAK